MNDHAIMFLSVPGRRSLSRIKRSLSICDTFDLRTPCAHIAKSNTFLRYLMYAIQDRKPNIVIFAHVDISRRTERRRRHLLAGSVLRVPITRIVVSRSLHTDSVSAFNAHGAHLR